MLKLLSLIYAAGVARRNARFDSGRQPIVKIGKPVVSVGNISAGGTGKTPVVQSIVRILQEQGKRPAIVMRGYRRTTKGLLVIHDGSKLCAGVNEAGDEAFFHAETLGIPVVVCEDKVEAATYAVKKLPCDVIVVDDGFQHRALHRDCDIVLIDRATLNGQLIPRGRLREPLTAMHRADVVLCVGDVSINEVSTFAQESALVIHCPMRADTPRSIENDAEELQSSARVIAVAGIAHPQRFVSTLEDGGFDIVSERLFRDHHRYTSSDVSELVAEARDTNAVIITTDKDIVKLRPHLFVNGALQAPTFAVSIHAVLENTAFIALLARRTSR
ncbi:MAG: tetraacyldisaccharide 4'-kinase [Candidatus Kapabacteria bacterium]|nr:tetraacyldisaccharide 4'-kinase [Candidatus Kapabacteria bacterium]